MTLTLEAIAEKIRQHPKLVIADDFEIALQRSGSRAFRYQNGSPRAETRRGKLWVSLRILHRKRGGKAVVTNPSIEDIHTLVEAAFESAQRSSVDPWFRFPIWKPLAPVDKLDEVPPISSVFPMIADRGFALEEAYETRFFETFLRRKTERFFLKHQGQSRYTTLSLLSEAGDETLFLRDEYATSPGAHTPTEWLKTLSDQADRRRSVLVQPCGHGKKRVVFSPRAAVFLVEHIAPWFYASSIQNGKSPFSDEGQSRSFSSHISLSDHGSLGTSARSAPFDLEGVPTQKTVLVDKGGLKSWLYDVYSATRENRLSTGNYLRWVDDSVPKISPSCFFIEAGECGVPALLRTAGTGIWIDNVRSMEPVPGEGSHLRLQADGWRIAAGELAEPVSGIEAVFDPMHLLQRVAQVGSDLSFFGAFGSPSIFVEELPLGS